MLLVINALGDEHTVRHTHACMHAHTHTHTHRHENKSDFKKPVRLRVSGLNICPVAAYKSIKIGKVIAVLAIPVATAL